MARSPRRLEQSTAHLPPHGNRQDDTDLRDMEAIIQKLGSYRVIRNSYDLLHDPD
ncbi:hypothetical protein HFN86_33820 [Rhizobium laguerreae]|uniref:hypothetical protein n=1 Tax=Rhizobium laguerreae TaxID=1076926 RepID=UPI001C907896|nr:hypothetical protein [Rhizobium laguerreae]MBY3425118.1 hypothetical protein [Rhizobium laguerreae]